MPDFTEAQLNDKLLRLHNQLTSVEKDKKVAMGGYKDQIGDLKAEIKEVVEALNELKGS